MPVTTDAYVARPGNKVSLEKITYPDLGPNELFVAILSASLCHSDVRAVSGAFHLKPPLVIGHEAAGFVKEVGSAVSYVKPGDAVVLAYASCGSCRRCISGKQPYCDRMFDLNFSGKGEDGAVVARDERDEPVSGRFFGQSSMSRVALVYEGSCVKIDCTREELKLFASLGCGVQTGAGCILNVARPPVGSSIEVFGGGAVGLSAVLAAKLYTPSCLVLVDNSQAKLDMIPKQILHGVITVNSAGKTPDQIADELRALTPTQAGMDYALDCVGNESVIAAAHLSLDKLGTMINPGGHPDAKASYKVEHHLVKGATSRGTHQGDSVPRTMIPHLIQLWKAGKFPFDQMLTEFPFEDLHKALEETHRGNVIKPLLIL